MGYYYNILITNIIYGNLNTFYQIIREKELILYTENYRAVGTQAAVLAGFTTTCLIETDIRNNKGHPYATSLLHIAAITSICANIACVSLSTMAGVWGSAKALRGADIDSM